MDTDLAAVLRRAEDAVRRARRNLEEARATLACAGARVAREKRLMSDAERLTQEAPPHRQPSRMQVPPCSSLLGDDESMD